jgi:DNA-binding NtrC family response regulator
MESFMKPTLLIAEDDADLRSVYQKFLSQRGYEVMTASDGLDCLAKLRQVWPAALVLDRDLRWGGSEGVLAWLREEKAATAMPVLLTATAGDPPGAAAVRPPVVTFLPKPFTLTLLLESVRAALGKSGSGDLFRQDHASAQSELFIGRRRNGS